jgi:hypothetical protein
MFARFSRCQTSVIRKKQLERNCLIFCMVMGRPRITPSTRGRAVAMAQAEAVSLRPVEDIPDRLVPANVYLAGEDNNLWAAAMLCPCGCKDVIELNLLTQARPSWKVQQHSDGTVSLAPSVWRQKGCGSHFFVRQGRIDWC